MTPVDLHFELQARNRLGLGPNDPPATWRAAFQRMVKACHPDQGGDDEKVRLVIEAYRYLKDTEAAWQRGRRVDAGPRAASPPPQRPQAQAQPAPEPEAEAPEAADDISPQSQYRISILEAFHGTDRTFRLRVGKRFKVRLPAGLQSGDVVRFGEDGQHRLNILVEDLPSIQLKGADLWITIKVSQEFLVEGGRMEIDHPLGPRKFWVSRTSVARGVFRAPGEGLPARPGRARGHLYLRFEHDAALDDKPAKSLLSRFAKAWAAA